MEYVKPLRVRQIPLLPTTLRKEYPLPKTDEKERKEVLRNIYNLLKEQGSLYLEVRTEVDILKSKHIEPFGDGYLLGVSNVKTFQKPYNQKSLVELLTSNGFIVQEVNNLGRSIFIKASKGDSNV